MSVESLSKIIGINIVLQRKRLGFSQKELASKLNIAYETLGRIERGTATPTIKRLENIAQVLECSVAFLVQSSPHNLQEKSKRLVESLENLSEGKQDIALSIFYATIDALSKK